MITKRLVRWLLALTVPDDLRGWAKEHTRDLAEVAGAVVVAIALALLDLRLGLLSLGIMIIAAANFGGKEGDTDAGTQ